MPTDHMSARRALQSPVVLACALALALLLSYPLEHWSSPVGFDSTVYLWWARVAGHSGLDAPIIPIRPGSIAPVAVLLDVVPERAGMVMAVLGPLLTVCLALELAAFTDAALGRDGVRRTLVVILTVSYLTGIAAAYLSTLAFGAAFFAALAALAQAMKRASRSWSVAAGLLLACAVLAHPLFLALGLPLLAGGALAALVGAGGRTRAVLGTLAWALGVGAVVTVVLLVGGGLHHEPLALSADAAVRATAGNDSLVSPFSLRARSSLERLWPYAGMAFACLLFLRLGSAPRPPTGRPRRGWPAETERFFWGVVVTWTIIVVAGCALLFFGVPVAAQRLVDFALPIPLFFALVLSALRRRGARPQARWSTAIVVMLIVVLVVAVGWSRWIAQQPPLSSSAVAEGHAASGLLARAAPGTDLVVALSPQRVSIVSTILYANYLRGAAPPARTQHIYVFPGSPPELVGGQVPAADPSVQPFVHAYARAARRVLDPADLVIAVRSFDREAYVEAATLGGRARGPGVIALPGYRARLDKSASGGGTAGFVTNATVLWLCPLLLVLLSAAGWGWLRPLGPDGALHACLAPAAGFALLSLTAMVADGLGIRLSQAGAPLAVGIPLVGSALLALLSHRGRFASRTSPPPAQGDEVAPRAEERT